MDDTELIDAYNQLSGISVDQLVTAVYGKDAPGAGVSIFEVLSVTTIYDDDPDNPAFDPPSNWLGDNNYPGYDGSNPVTTKTKYAEGTIADEVDFTYRIVLGASHQTPISLDPESVPYPGPTETKPKQFLLPESRLFVECLLELVGKGKNGGFDEFDAPSLSALGGGLGLTRDDMRRVWVRRLATSVWVDRQAVFPWKLWELGNLDFHILLRWEPSFFRGHLKGPQAAVDPLNAGKHFDKMAYPKTPAEAAYGTGAGSSQNLWEGQGGRFHFGLMWDPNPKKNFAAAALAGLRYTLFDHELFGDSFSWKTHQDGIAAVMYHVYKMSINKPSQDYDGWVAGVGHGKALARAAFDAEGIGVAGTESFAPWAAMNGSVPNFFSFDKYRIGGGPELALYFQAVLRAMNIPCRVYTMPTIVERPFVCFWQNFGCSPSPNSKPWDAKPGAPGTSFVTPTLMTVHRTWAVVCPSVMLGLADAEFMLRIFGYHYTRSMTALWQPLAKLVDHWIFMKDKSMNKAFGFSQSFKLIEMAANLRSIQLERLIEAVIGFCTTSSTRYKEETPLIAAAAQAWAKIHVIALELENSEDEFSMRIAQASRARFFSFWWVRAATTPHYQLWPLTIHRGLFKHIKQPGAEWWFDWAFKETIEQIEEHKDGKQDQFQFASAEWLVRLKKFVGQSTKTALTVPSYGKYVMNFYPPAGLGKPAIPWGGEWLQCYPEVAQAIDGFATEIVYGK